MANALFPKFKQSLLNKEIDMDTDTIKVRLVTVAYVYSAAHQFLSDTTGAVGADQVLGAPTIVSGVFDANDSTWTAVAAGAAVTAVIIYKDTGVAGTSNLIAYLDTGFTGSPGIPVTPNGGNIVITWNASGIFAL